MIAPLFCIDINMKLSRMQSRLRPLLSVAAVMAIVFSSEAPADCHFYSGYKTITMNYGSKLTEGLTVPQDAPIGTVIYQEIISAEYQRFNCGAPTLYGFVLNPALGSVTSGSTFPLGKTGLSFRIGDDIGYLEAARMDLYKDPNWSVPATDYRLEIIKSSELASENSVPAGYLGQYQAGSAVFNKFYLINPIILNTASCQTPAVSVQMGDDYRLDEFNKSGDTPRTIKFNLALNQCQRGIKKVTYSLKATTQVIDAQKGIVALSAGSTAKGIGLQLMNEAGQPIALDTTYPFDGFNTTGTSFNIPLSAAYYRLAGSKLEAGTANTEVTFIVNYL
ncbi:MULTISPECIES: fimbrial protein [unclassified Pseudomonas]|uniref:fimbrial protein n=1 Tax=unclassified Pseudomonas TaxID=196821 RepID=UPI0021148BB6|nr:MULTISPECIES: fimbrial protein [unclassified Pseudomonas]